jgi:uncharacterized membrane protein YdjX (TVP38/TMEM64 family)
MALSFLQVKRAISLLWFGLILALLLFFAFNPAFLSAEGLAVFFQQFEGRIWAAYIFIFVVRGIFLIPSTPFVLAGALLFPQNTAWVVVISLFSVLSSATFLYYWADWIGIGQYLEKKYPKKAARVAELLNKPYALLLVIGWAFFPLVPTDLICYIARIIGMKYRIMIFGIFLGELALILGVVYFTNIFVGH